jgi:serine/threonine protein kinase
MREKAFLADIDHPNIVKLLHQYVSPNYNASNLRSQNTVFFIEEDGGRTVQGYLREIYYNPSARPVPVQIIYRICSDILQALLYLELRGILHRDIKGDSNALFCFFSFVHHTTFSYQLTMQMLSSLFIPILIHQHMMKI